MQALEKILEEIEREAVTNKEIGRKQCEGMARAMNIVSSHIDNANDINISSKCSECSRRKWYQYGYEDGKKDMCNDGWIPVEDGLPEEHDSIFANFKGTENWNIGMFEKKSDNVNVTIELEDGTRKTTISCTLDGNWKIERELGFVKKKVVAWKPFPKPYKSENRNNNTTKEYQQEVEHLLEEMKTENGYIRVSNLVKRFEKIDKELFKNSSWNLLQILSNINILIPKHFD